LHIDGQERRLLVALEISDVIQIPSPRIASDATQEIFPGRSVWEPRPHDGSDRTAGGTIPAIECCDTGMREIPIVSSKQFVAAVA
jgi:hypothetical protein